MKVFVNEIFVSTVAGLKCVFHNSAFGFSMTIIKDIDIHWGVESRLQECKT